ncbi:MAG: hypothetical protein EYC62_03580 [Alphaproteobacteria bacterium]|nr:MAG: hypothetical protein EYC62_03580 [Alphaproteobacteria bacterium]
MKKGQKANKVPPEQRVGSWLNATKPQWKNGDVAVVAGVKVFGPYTSEADATADVRIKTPGQDIFIVDLRNAVLPPKKQFERPPIIAPKRLSALSLREMMDERKRTKS